MTATYISMLPCMHAFMYTHTAAYINIPTMSTLMQLVYTNIQICMHAGEMHIKHHEMAFKWDAVDTRMCSYLDS